MQKQMQSDQHQRAELFAREPGLLTRKQTTEVARCARTPLRCPQRLVIRGQRWQMHACCKEGVASNRCVKLPTVDPLSHLRIDWLRRTELRYLKFGPIRHLHAFSCQQRGCVLGVPPILEETACTLVLLGHTPGTDNLPKTPNRLPVTTSWRSEDPTLLHGKANGSPQQPHQWALALPKSQRDTPSNWCHGFGRTVTLQMEVNFEGCGLLWVQYTSGVAAHCASWTTGIQVRNCWPTNKTSARKHCGQLAHPRPTLALPLVPHLSTPRLQW